MFLARLYWFTVEFGLVQKPGVAMRHEQPGPRSAPGNASAADAPNRVSPDAKTWPNEVRIYGGGILSSIGETDYAYSSNVALRKRFDLLDVLRTPYRIDIMQPLYYVLEDFAQLTEITKRDLMADVAEARKLGLHAPLYPLKAPAAATKSAA